MNNRDKEAYRNKGLRETTIKTVFGEVNYSRRVYETTRDDGFKEFVYLLDEQLHISGVGLISQNLAEKLVSGITEMSYRETATKITEMTGQRISAMGVYVNLQREKQDMAEIKVGIAYEGWKQTDKDCFELDGKVVVAGFSKAKEFQAYREAAIAEKYHTDEIEIRMMNADGAEWIKNLSEADTVFQLDPFHRNKAIRECIGYKEVVQAIHELLNTKDIDGVFQYLEIYHDSLTDDTEIEKAEKLIMYFRNNRKGLLSYQEQGVVLPEHPKGLKYRNMGTMENHIWSTIARRMKHNHTSWSYRGGNHLAKILAKKCSGRLDEVSTKLKSKRFETRQTEMIQREILSAGSVPKRIGKGYIYPVKGHLTRLENSSGITHQTYMAKAGC